MANFEKDFNKKMEQLGYSLTYYNDKSSDPIEDESPETTSIYVGWHILNGTVEEYLNFKNDLEVEMISKTFRVPKNKLITPEYMLEKINKENVFLVIDAMSFQYLIGSQVDYTEGLEGSRFVIKNPNAKTTCGCGSSFGI